MTRRVKVPRRIKRKAAAKIRKATYLMALSCIVWVPEKQRHIYRHGRLDPVEMARPEGQQLSGGFGLFKCRQCGAIVESAWHQSTGYTQNKREIAARQANTA